MSVAYSADGSRIVSGAVDKTSRVWDATTGELIRKLEGHSEGVRSIAFSADGSRIVSGSLDKTSRVWDATTGELIHTLEGHAQWRGHVCCLQRRRVPHRVWLC